MPCNCDYMNPTTLERQLSEVACMLDEVKSGKKINKSEFAGYHPKVYSKATRELGDALVSELCSLLQSADVTKYNLEVQIWWRDHQKADKARVEQEMKRLKSDKERQEALSKLTEYERKLLGLS